MFIVHYVASFRRPSSTVSHCQSTAQPRVGPMRTEKCRGGACVLSVACDVAAGYDYTRGEQHCNDPHMSLDLCACLLFIIMILSFHHSMYTNIH